MRWIVFLAILVQNISWLATGTKIAQAETFVSSAFQNEWNATDADVANGKAKRTLFWGPQPFAHTIEVYNEAPNGTREVQYFDKGRMELTGEAGQNPNLVTNGLLTEELVSGKMQVGDNSFLTRLPANIPVAGDLTNNDSTPTYASFSKNGLVYGLAGAVPAPIHRNQIVEQSLNKDGIVTISAFQSRQVTYSIYSPQTQHNIANVFYNFFLTAPLGADKWLPVMGYPISEPYWITTTLAGKKQNVLVQLFERRALTYTPTNPNGFQVEMTNIGQHYYAWRYNVNLSKGAPPGNNRLLYVADGNLYSGAVNEAPSFKVAALSGNPYYAKLWAVSNGIALINNADTHHKHQQLYLVDLTKPNTTPTLVNFGAGVTDARIQQVALMPDAKSFIAVFDSYVPDLTDSQSNNGIYVKTFVQKYTFNGINIISSELLYQETIKFIDNLAHHDGGAVIGPLSPDLRYLPIMKSDTLILVDLNNQSLETVNFGYKVAFDILTFSQWLPSGQLLLGVHYGKYGTTSGMVTVEPVSRKTTMVITDLGASFGPQTLSPDGKYFAWIEFISLSVIVHIQSTSNFGTDLASVTRQVPSPHTDDGFGEWAADGSFLTFNYGFQLSDGKSYESHFLRIVPTNGRVLSDNSSQSSYNDYSDDDVAAPYYLTNFQYTLDPTDTHISFVQISSQNLDGSEKVLLYQSSHPETKAGILGMVQVPRST